jgi:acyl-[acyl-carrier-protein]-phospholipid O-acyltransferase/long-chain-fatty-acid--[acyl-carrier-protein] ligase
MREEEAMNTGKAKGDEKAGKLPRSFRWLNATQFLGALNDNMFKLFIIFYLIGVQGADQAGMITAKAGAVFVLPFLLFSAASGVLADRLSKQRIIVAVKVMEVAVMLLGAAAFWTGSRFGLYAVLFLMATQSSLFGPSKYGIVPELVQKDQLSRANGVLESLTYLAIVLGTGLAPFLAQAMSADYHRAAIVCVVFAVAGLAACLKIGTTPPAGSAKEISPLFLREIWKTLRSIRRDGYLFLAVLGSAYFLFLGAFIQINLIPYGMETLALGQEQSGYLFLVAAVGIGLGAFWAGKLSGRNVEFGVVPIGAAGLALAPMALSAAPPSLLLIVTLILLLGLSAGLFMVPLHAFIQMRAPREKLGEILAASGFLSWVGVLLASALTWLLTGALGLSAARGFQVVGILTLGLTLITLKILPDFLLRFLALAAMKCCYRLKVVGRHNVPLEGPALLVPNHVTWLDALLLTATQQRRIRFVMHRSIYNTRWLNPLFRLMGVIPVASGDSRHDVAAFVKAARAALDEGYMVCIFAEGAITRTGMMQEFRSGVEWIVKGTDYPVIPVYIGGAWGSIFSYAHGRLLAKLPTLRPYPITVLFGTPLPATSRAAEIRQAVMELSGAYFDSRKAKRKSLGEAFVRCARVNWKQRALSDTGGKELSYGKALTGAAALAEKIGRDTAGQDKIGILLPPSVGGALANLAVTLLGKVPVNLNYTASTEAFRSAIDQCGIRTALTSGAFLEKVSLPPVEGAVLIEDLLARLTPREKRRAWLRARFLPAGLLCPSGGFLADDPATIIFSSGSTGEPKGVMLSHHNILSNLEATRMVAGVTSRDSLCSALPFFHALGFTTTLWLPLLSGFAAVYHVNPMDGATIAMAVREKRSTLLITTPTFLLPALRRAAPEDFASLRLVVTGGEKLKERVAESFRQRFGLCPLEGYGATELSPLATLNLPDVTIDGFRQAGARSGSVGHPIPGVTVRVVDPETEAALPPGETGLILVKGPNVMLGYLNRPEKTAEVLRDGWYVTGDIGRLDGDGFLTITDRLSRFSKIGGEMVPHHLIEDELHRLTEQTGQVLAVTSVADDRKGERLAVLYTGEAGDPERLHRAMSESALPNLWKPHRDSYVAVAALPILGSGKLDLKGLRQLAEEGLAPAVNG